MTQQLSVIERALTSDPPDLAPADLRYLAGAGLAGQIRGRLSPRHDLHSLLRAEHGALGLRHTAIRAELRALLSLWNKEGIVPCLFKGFALAEFVYASPGERFYGDVDLLLPDDPALVSRAVHLALAHGWHSDGQYANPRSWTHESAHLLSPSSQTRLDIHRFVIGGHVISRRRARALTQGLWERARLVDWQGAAVWLCDPRDASVMNTVLNRQWSGEIGQLKPADYTDLQVLAGRYHLTPAALNDHARQLRAEATWEAFGAVCSPAQRRLVLDPGITRPLLVAAAQRDGLNLRRRTWLRRGLDLPRRLRWLLRLAPDAAAVFGALRSGRPPLEQLPRWTPRRTGSLDFSQVQDVVHTATLLTRLLYPRMSGRCLPRAYLTYRALRRLGYPAVFVSGVKRTAQAFQGHAWVEGPHGALDAYGEPLNRSRFSELFHYPP